MNIFHNTNVILVYGNSGNGKTTTAIKIKDLDQYNKVIHTDGIFLYENSPQLIDLYFKSNQDVSCAARSEEFLYYKHIYIFAIIQEIEQILKSTSYVSNIIIEGYALMFCLKEITDFFNKRDLRIYLLEMINFNIFIDQKEITFNEFQNVLYSKEVLNKSNYQSFDFLNDIVKDSSSLNKFILSGLDKINLNDKVLVDFGCNCGYFLFKLKDKNCKLIGVDVSKDVLKIAYDINRSFIKTDNITLYNMSCFDFTEKVNVVFAASMFHYLIDQQQQFIDHCYNILNINGILLLEIEEHTDNENINTFKIARRDGESCLNYPNEKKIHQMIHRKFYVKSKTISSHQSGSFFNRYFYHLIKL
jgi:2-polyprenyl-3-methyl-5-hydroxy-6-metoxy-1,4-benzoquinol methylase